MNCFELKGARGEWSAILVDGYLHWSQERKEYNAADGPQNELSPLADEVALRWPDAKQGFHEQDMLYHREEAAHATTCQLYAMQFPEDSASDFPNINWDVNHDDTTSSDRRVAVALVHKNCPRAPLCMEYLTHVADLMIRSPGTYPHYKAVAREFEDVMRKLVLPFDNPAETSLQALNATGTKAAASPQ